MIHFDFFLASTLEKVFPNQRPQALADGTVQSAWKGTKAAVQLVYFMEGGNPENWEPERFSLTIQGGPCDPELCSVELIPSDFPCYTNADDGYITKEPGLFPDLLEPMVGNEFKALPGQYRSIWILWDIPENVESGEYQITIKVQGPKAFLAPNGTQHQPKQPTEEVCCHLVLSVGKHRLAKQRLLHTEWFYADCLASYYQVPVFSEEHWQIVRRFIREAASHGINLLLTPVFTPPLDTAVGSERLTVQLVVVTCNQGKYSFDFSRLERWTKICREFQIENLEIAHLFTQWGAKATPKIMATVDGVEKKIFGWEVAATAPEYRVFLEAFLPALRQELSRLGFDEKHVYYHISDEPAEQHLHGYQAALRQVGSLLEGCQVIDALSDLRFYHEGIVQQPIVANDHIQPFLDEKVPDLWVYYCCAQSTLVPNRFYALPSFRNRIMGVLWYLYDLKGFLQWGYNFYNLQYSRGPADPFRVTHCGYAFPSGDPYLVYPGPDGVPLSSIRAEVQDDALTDLRAFQLLESLTSRETVETLIYENVSIGPITFVNYPQDAEYLLNLREKVASELQKLQ